MKNAIEVKGFFETLQRLREIKRGISSAPTHKSQQLAISEAAAALADDPYLGEADELWLLLADMAHKASEEQHPGHEGLEARQLLALCERLEVRFLATVAAAAACREKLEEVLHVNLERVFHGSSGMSHASVAKYTVILLPTITLLNQDSVASDLIRLHDQPAASQLGWILDFSAQTEPLPLAFWGVLNMFRQLLNKEGKPLLVVWLRPSACPPAVAPQLTAAFNLRQIGGFFFSEQRA